MIRDPNLDAISSELKGKYNVHTVILYGSRARNEHGPASDYDIVGIGSVDRVIRDARTWNGFFLDAFVYPESKIQSPDASMLHMREGVVLFEKGDTGTQFLKALDEIYSRGPEKLPPDEIHARIVWASKMIERARQQDTEGNYRRVWLLTALVEDYFLIRGLWYSGPKKALSWLAKNNPPVYAAYEKALKPNAELADIEDLVKLVTGVA